MRSKIYVLLFLIAGLVPIVSMSAGAAHQSNLPEGFIEEPPITGFTRPIAFTWLPDGRMLVGEKYGDIWLVEDGQVTASPVLKIAVTRSYDAGLLGLAADPEFSTKPYVYVYYTVSPRSLNHTGTLHNRVSRFRMLGNQAVPQSEHILIDDISLDTTTNHNGGDLRFGSDGMLYVSVGDGGHPERAQSLDSPHGKILRIDPATGQGVPGNPFYSAMSGKQRNRVWAYGLRNPFRFVFEPGTDTILVGDVGWQTYEELNRVYAGRNYGWPLEEGPNDLGTEGLEEPLFWYGRTSNSDPDFDECSTIIGGDFVRGANFPPAYAGAYFFADYTCQRIWYKRPSSAPALFARSAGNPVHVAFGPDGMLYYTDVVHNVLRRIRFANSNGPPTAHADASPRVGPAPLAVQFTSAGSSDPDGSMLKYHWDYGDGATSSDPAPKHVYTIKEPVTATLTVTDADGAATTAVPIRLWPGDTAPSVTIEAPADGTHIPAGSTIALQGVASDAEDGELAGEAMLWEAVLHHGTTHTHLWDTGTGKTLRITMPSPEDLATAGTSFLEVTLTARDRQGAASAHTIRLLPDTSALTFQTDPPGLMLKLDGQLYRTPVIIRSAKGWPFSVRDFFQATRDCRGYAVGSWSNGRPSDHLLVTPNVDTVITATMREIPVHCYHMPWITR
jgi:glucose/arabinose dehydrogenase